MRFQPGTDGNNYNGGGTFESEWGYDGSARDDCLYVATTLEVPNGEIEDLCDACTASAGFVTVIGYISALLVIVMMITTLLRLCSNNFNTDMIKTIQVGCGFSISILMFFGFVSFKGACQAVIMEVLSRLDYRRIVFCITLLSPAHSLTHAHPLRATIILM